MTALEIAQGKLHAAECLVAVRKCGGVTLRLWRETGWYLYMHNGHAVPSELKFRLLELEPFVMVLLREMAQ